jgi:anti-sigma regulatory factor (Ser/Thr protein kinase)
LLSSIAIRIEESSHVGAARRCATQLAGESNFNEVDVARAALIAAEAATNILKHARQGLVLLRRFDDEGTQVLELLAVDNGPGVADARVSVTDGYSTSGTPGNGLGAIRRSADLFALYSPRGVGTVLLAQIRKSSSEVPADATVLNLIAGGVCVAMPGESLSGDAWDALPTSNGMKVAVVDGLGHGPQAAEASALALKTFRQQIDRPPGEIITQMHAAIRSTRGAAAAVAEIDRTTNALTFAGVGNISAMIVSEGRAQRLVSHNGIVGHEMRKVQQFKYEWSAGSSLWMQSDGLSTLAEPSRYPGATSQHPSIVAALLYRDLNRGRDDSTAVVVHEWSAN